MVLQRRDAPEHWKDILCAWHCPATTGGAVICTGRRLNLANQHSRGIQITDKNLLSEPDDPAEVREGLGK